MMFRNGQLTNSRFELNVFTTIKTFFLRTAYQKLSGFRENVVIGGASKSKPNREVVVWSFLQQASVRLSLLLGVIGFPLLAVAQDTLIQLNNPSFFDQPHVGGPEFNRAPRGWYDCGAPGETPPDVQPNPNIAFGDVGYFHVTLKAQEGKTYLGMVVRDNDTQEAVGQRLTSPLVGGKCYEMSMFLARSSKYLSQSRVDSMEANYTTPVKVRIYGGSAPCQKAELLTETPLVKNTAWKKYELTFKPTTNHDFIVIQAFYKTPTLFPYNGNVLVDNISAIKRVACDDEDVAAVTPPEKTEPTPPQKPTTQPTPTPEPPVAETPAPPAAEKPSKPSPPKPVVREFELGESVNLKKLFFQIDRSDINEEAYEELNEVSNYLKVNDGIRIEIHGHTNNRCDDAFCNQLSKERAESVANYLIAQGISEDRIIAVGHGKTKPIASNKYRAGRLKNQRVEIKMLEI